MNIKQGQKVFVKPIGNAARRNNGEVFEAIVKIVGRKYFELDQSYRGRFFIETGLQDGHGYISDYAVYESMEEIALEKELYEIKEYLCRCFERVSCIDLSLEVLRSIKNIIEANKDGAKSSANSACNKPEAGSSGNE